LILHLEGVAAGGSEDAGGAEPLIGRLRAVVDAVLAGALFCHELLHRLEVVDVGRARA